jgi:hypothetical protein
MEFERQYLLRLLQARARAAAKAAASGAAPRGHHQNKNNKNKLSLFKVRVVTAFELCCLPETEGETRRLGREDTGDVTDSSTLPLPLPPPPLPGFRDHLKLHHPNLAAAAAVELEQLRRDHQLAQVQHIHMHMQMHMRHHAPRHHPHVRSKERSEALVWHATKRAVKTLLPDHRDCDRDGALENYSGHVPIGGMTITTMTMGVPQPSQPSQSNQSKRVALMKALVSERESLD